MISAKLIVAGLVAAGVATVAVAKIAKEKVKENDELREAGKKFVEDSKVLGKAVAEVTKETFKDAKDTVKTKYAESKFDETADSEFDDEHDSEAVMNITEDEVATVESVDTFEDASTTIEDDEIITEE